MIYDVTASYDCPHEIAFREVPTPQAEAGEVLLRVVKISICEDFRCWSCSDYWHFCLSIGKSRRMWRGLYLQHPAQWFRRSLYLSEYTKLIFAQWAGNTTIFRKPSRFYRQSALFHGIIPEIIHGGGLVLCPNSRKRSRVVLACLPMCERVEEYHIFTALRSSDFSGLSCILGDILPSICDLR